MAKILPDGTVIPSFMSTERSTGRPTYSGENDFGLKIGTITKVFYSDDEGNLRKNQIEYDVKVGERKGRKGFNISIYKNCVCIDLFGGIADTMEWTYRPSDDGNVPNAMFQTGSRVLILCLSGDSNGGVIIGGVRNVRRKKVSGKVRGHFFECEFNGINIEVNKDGELTFTYKSKTDIKGTPQVPTTGGSFIKIDKTGSIEANDGNGTWIRIDKPTKTIKEDAVRAHVTNAPSMKIGGDGATEPLILGNVFMAFYNAMVSVFNSHTHEEHDWAAGPGAPHTYVTRAPSNAGKAPLYPGKGISTNKMTAAQLSDFVKTKKTYKK